MAADTCERYDFVLPPLPAKIVRGIVTIARKLCPQVVVSAELLDRYLGPKFEEEPMNFSIWRRVESVPDSELWRTHERRRERMVAFARMRLQQQLNEVRKPEQEATR